MARARYRPGEEYTPNKEQRGATSTLPASKPERRRKRRDLPYYGEYELKQQFHQTYYPGTNIRDMSYRVPGWGKRGYSWEKMHGRLVRYRQKARRGPGG